MKDDSKSDESVKKDEKQETDDDGKKNDGKKEDGKKGDGKKDDDKKEDDKDDGKKEDDKDDDKKEDDKKEDGKDGDKKEDEEKEQKEKEDDKEKKTKLEIHVPTNAELAANLKGHLLLVHGEVDNNVHPAGTMRLVDALIKANKRFDMLIIPGKRHGYGDAQPYFTQRMWEYFAEHLLGDHLSGADIRIKSYDN